jgi:hypothetical protein
MDLTHTQLRTMVDIYNNRHHGFKSWYAFIGSMGVGERVEYPYNRIIYILDPHLFTVACIRYGI